MAAVLLFTRGSEGVALQLLDDGGGPMLTGWVADGFSIAVRELTLVGAILVVLLSLPYLRRIDRGHGEFYALLLFAVLGVMLVSGVSDLLSLFVCLELVTISSYVLAAFKRGDARSTEAGLKYLVVGAVSSAILLLGIAFVYGAVGEVAFPSLTAAGSAGSPSLLLVGGPRPRRRRHPVQGRRRPVPRLDPGRLPGRPEPRRGLPLDGIEGGGHGPAAPPGADRRVRALAGERPRPAVGLAPRRPRRP